MRCKITELQAYFTFILLNLLTKLVCQRKYPSVSEYVRGANVKKL